jgi:hypothetical protein
MFELAHLEQTDPTVCNRHFLQCQGVQLPWFHQLAGLTKVSLCACQRNVNPGQIRRDGALTGLLARQIGHVRA